MSLKIHVPSAMAKAAVESVTTETTGYEKGNVNDFNPDRYWKRS